ncbi:MAG TPA: hypothetical protein DCX54_02140 [Flavobacteriales bacterium]|nr:hypothetical protein [Flavobacteriales bacterium]
MAEEIVNRVANSELVQLELDDYAFEIPIKEYDIAQNLFEGLILREKEFRGFIDKFDWSVYRGMCLAIVCSTGAIIPNWAFMLLASALESAGASCHYGSETEVRERILIDRIHEIAREKFAGKKVLIKGCGKFEPSPEVYLSLTRTLQPHVRSLMFGEACSTVPVFKKVPQ